MNYKLPISLLAFTFFIVNLNFAQKSQGKLELEGEKFLKKGDFAEALSYFSSMDSTTKVENPLYDYYMGLFYFYSPNDQEKGIPHLRQYLSEADSTSIENNGHHHVYYILGKLHHLNYEFVKAQELYGIFIKSIEMTPAIPEKERINLINRASREIEQCKFGVVAVQNPRHVIIESLGDSINTIYPEYAAIVSQDEKSLFFTSRRPREGSDKKDKDGQYFEDIYQATLAKGSLFETVALDTANKPGFYFNLVTDFLYTDFKRMNEKVNGEDHEGSVQLYQNDSLLLFYRDSDIWSVPLNDNEDSEPQKLDGFINSSYHEPSVFFSYDGTSLFIVSDRPGGYGGLDLYISKRDGSDKWSTPKNMGPEINTPFDEDAPYLDPDGETFYFSSKGHSSMGEYDIFRSVFKDTSWSAPVNLGYPINTPAEDIFFTMTERYNRGYYSSGDLKGQGDIDLYRITFSDERDPVAELKGFVKQGEKLIPAQSNITLSIKNSDEEISTQTDSISGDYFLLLGHGKSYEMNVNTTTFAQYSHEFTVPEQKEYFQLYQEIHHVHLFDAKGDTIGQKITVFNALGEKDSTIKLYDYDEELRSKLEKIGYKLDYEGVLTVDSEVKFYMTFDSLMTLMAEDSTILYNFPPNTRISFLSDNSMNKFEHSSYKELSQTLNEEIEARKDGKVIEVEFSDTADVIEPIAYEEIEGLFFTVQVGLYSKPVPHEVLYNLAPIHSNKTVAGNIRYAVGYYPSVERAIIGRDEIINMGIKDAFVTAYYKGKRITCMEATQIVEKFGASVLMKNID